VSTLVLELSQGRASTKARVGFDVVCAVAGSLLIAGLAQISIPLGFTPVPITGQTLGVLLVGAAFGPALGAATLLLYLAEGAVGLPFFAHGAHGASYLGAASVTAGYLWAFVFAAAIAGWLARAGWDRSLRSSLGAMLLGSLAIYVIALPWLHHALPAVVGAPVSWQTTFEDGLYPFVIGDTLKLLLAAGLLPVAWRALERFGRKKEGSR
jgi:biotin transport system substrate-specific component